MAIQRPRLPVGPGPIRAIPLLTPREMQLAVLVETGMPNKEIAARLDLAVGTIKVYMCRLFLKAKVRTRGELAVWWREHGGEDRMHAPGLVDCATCPLRILAEAKALNEQLLAEAKAANLQKHQSDVDRVEANDHAQTSKDGP